MEKSKLSLQGILGAPNSILRSRIPNCASVDAEIMGVEIIECESPAKMGRYGSTIRN